MEIDWTHLPTSRRWGNYISYTAEFHRMRTIDEAGWFLRRHLNAKDSEA
jgi:hypothetical protein